MEYASHDALAPMVVAAPGGPRENAEVEFYCAAVLLLESATIKYFIYFIIINCVIFNV